MNHYLYLLIDVACLIIPFLFSFYPKTNFFSEWKWFFPANFLVGILFLLWDEYFTQIGVWGFNPDYLTGYYIGNLPIEEILFFFCIPYACTFTYFVIQKYGFTLFNKQITNILLVVLFLICYILLIIGFPKWYTSVTMALCLIFILVYGFYFQKHNPFMLTMYVLIIFPFLISNGILTGSFIDEPVVWYNNQENLNVRIFTIPIEDFFYGFLLLSLNIFLYEKFKIIYTRR